MLLKEIYKNFMAPFFVISSLISFTNHTTSLGLKFSLEISLELKFYKKYVLLSFSDRNL